MKRFLSLLISLVLFCSGSGICGTFEDHKASIDAFYAILENKIFNTNWSYTDEDPHIPSQGMLSSAHLVAAGLADPIPDWYADASADERTEMLDKAFAVLYAGTHRKYESNAVNTFSDVNIASQKVWNVAGEIIRDGIHARYLAAANDLVSEIEALGEPSLQTDPNLLKRGADKTQIALHQAHNILWAALGLTPTFPMETDFASYEDLANIANLYAFITVADWLQTAGAVPFDCVECAAISGGGDVITVADAAKDMLEFADLALIRGDIQNMEDGYTVYGAGWTSMANVRGCGLAGFQVPRIYAAQLESLQAAVNTLSVQATSWKEHYIKHFDGLNNGSISFSSAAGAAYSASGGPVFQAMSQNGLMEAISLGDTGWTVYHLQNNIQLGGSDYNASFNARNLEGGKLKVTISMSKRPNDIKVYLGNTLPPAEISVGTAPAGYADITPFFGGLFESPRGYEISTTIDERYAGGSEPETGWSDGDYNGAWNDDGELYVILISTGDASKDVIIHDVTAEVAYPACSVEGNVLNTLGYAVAYAKVTAEGSYTIETATMSGDGGQFELRLPREDRTGNTTEYMICPSKLNSLPLNCRLNSGSDMSDVALVLAHQPLISVDTNAVGRSETIVMPPDANTMILSGDFMAGGCKGPLTLEVTFKGITSILGTYDTAGTYGWNKQITLGDTEYGSWTLVFTAIDGDGHTATDTRTLTRSDPNGLPAPMVELVGAERFGRTFPGATGIRPLTTGQQDTILLNLQNNGGWTDLGYLSLSVDDGLAIVAVDGQPIDPAVQSSASAGNITIHNYPRGYAPIYREDGTTTDVKTQLVDVTIPIGGSFQQVIKITVQGGIGVNQYDSLLYRAAFLMPDSTDYARYPSYCPSGCSLDQQGFKCENADVGEPEAYLETPAIDWHDDTVSLNWSGVDDVSFYNVYVSTGTDPSKAAILAQPEGPGYTTATLPANLNYNFWVEGVYADGSTTNAVSGFTSAASSFTDNPLIHNASLSAGYEHSLAIDSQGRLYAWGGNAYGQLGVGDNIVRMNPTLVDQNDPWLSVSAGEQHSIALTENGELYAWGNNTYYQLGIGYGLGSITPVRVGTDADWQAVDAGRFYNLGLRTDGKLYGWGVMMYEVAQYPTQVGEDTDWAAISVGDMHCLALKSDGRLYAWGGNSYGELGLNDNVDREIPVQVGTDMDWVAVSAGMKYSLALKNNGRLYAWGNNDTGQLGIGFLEGDKNAPVQVGSDTDWQSVSAGYFCSSGIKYDGRLFAWGSHQFGDPLPVDFGSPVQVGTDADWRKITTHGHNLLIKHSGQLYSWGENSSGQLGLGDDIDRDSPTRVGTSTDWRPTDPALNADVDADGLPDNWENQYLGGMAADGNDDSDADGLKNMDEYSTGTDPSEPDSEADGMPDGWEVAHNLDPLADDAGGDGDDDGLSNLEEYQGGTNPEAADAGAAGLGPALDNTDLVWTTSGSANWFAQTNQAHEGSASARSGAVGDAESSTLQATISGPGLLTHHYRVSSEAVCDKLYMWVNNHKEYEASGTVDWTKHETVITASGETVLQWDYEKDASEARGDDCAWVDGVVWTPFTDETDTDADGLPDIWEVAYFISLDQTGGHDGDADGLDNETENQLGTDPTRSDSDEDGMPDGWEAANGLRPTIDDSNNDLDSDGKTNLQEYQDETNPAIADINGEDVNLTPVYNLLLFSEDQ